MKKQFLIDVVNKTRDRQVDSIKNEIRKYIKREKSKKLPENFNTWFFDCKFGKSIEEAIEISFADIIKSVDFANKENYSSFYLEIIASAIFKEKKQSIDDEIIEN
ncbi:hypothetical protein AAX26_01022 [Aliarcobacter thereius]|uniref:Uncharacterized protein n=1 Tax=Aliarcobacter thereius TaxID=544718 RepID=A0A1C0B6F7_9BACT|nr:DUF6172 family protein [Aliarcobacter thereius]OCL86716.1 hypothetical protein AAX26_01022 [Aliarcobacter thereius]OCL98885.1 hypothetical protein AAX29_01395 [Aliarcobacter thereius]TLS72151.1 hypothetical protein FE246_06915 [Aliarcobacter thereius]TLT07393.1 hypothetical protein FE243_06000 [Aliarcobacter thereius]HJE03236.1 DUF6172 family protein [Aliarcobacter thereius]